MHYLKSLDQQSERPSVNLHTWTLVWAYYSHFHHFRIDHGTRMSNRMQNLCSSLHPPHLMIVFHLPRSTVVGPFMEIQSTDSNSISLPLKGLTLTATLTDIIKDIIYFINVNRWFLPW